MERQLQAAIAQGEEEVRQGMQQLDGAMPCHNSTFSTSSPRAPQCHRPDTLRSPCRLVPCADERTRKLRDEGAAHERVAAGRMAREQAAAEEEAQRRRDAHDKEARVKDNIAGLVGGASPNTAGTACRLVHAGTSRVVG